MKRIILILFVILNISLQAQSEHNAKYFVLVCIDGCRPEYLDFSNIPNIKKLQSEGTSFTEAWVGQLRNDTPPGHVSMSTGCFPKNTGIIGFSWKDSATKKIIRPTAWQDVKNGVFNQIIKNSGYCSAKLNI